MTPVIQNLLDRINQLELDDIQELLTELDTMIDAKRENLPQEPAHEYD